MSDGLVGLAEIADRLGVTKQRVYALVTRDDFPAPIDTLAQGRVWNRALVESWIAKHPQYDHSED